MATSSIFTDFSIKDKKLQNICKYHSNSKIPVKSQKSINYPLKKKNSIIMFLKNESISNILIVTLKGLKSYLPATEIKEIVSACASP